MSRLPASPVGYQPAMARDTTVLSSRMPCTVPGSIPVSSRIRRNRVIAVRCRVPGRSHVPLMAPGHTTRHEHHAVSAAGTGSENATTSRTPTARRHDGNTRPGTNSDSELQQSWKDGAAAGRDVTT